MTHSKHRHTSLHIALILAGGFAVHAQAQAIQIDTPTTVGQELGGDDTLTITSGGSVTVSGKGVSLKGATSGDGVTVDNSGQIISTGGRGIDSSGDETQGRNYTIVNRAGGLIQGSDDALRIDSDIPSGNIVIDNSGTIHSLTGQGLDLDALRGADVKTTVINHEGGLIRGDLSDGMKTGSNNTITNYGEISTGDSVTADDKFDGIDIDSATGVAVTNYGLISGGRHGITTDLGATLANFGTVIGRNGSGFGSDGAGTVVNHGTITGAYNGLQPDGDGDGVDIDLVGHIENYGTIQGIGASGTKDGFANGSEGIALGGGYVLNGAGALVSGANNGMLVDDGGDGPGVAATYLENHGTIQGLGGFGVKLSGGFDDRVINDGLISGSNGLALDMGGGNDSLTLLKGSRFVGMVDGGAGTDTVFMDDAAGGDFGASRNFESLQVRQGVWTLTGSGDFSAGGTVSSGAELVNQGGIAGTMTVDQGAVYAGGGAVGNLDVNGTLLANSALGAARVGGNLKMGSASTLVFGANADGSSAAVKVAGNANLGGASLAVNADQGSYPWQSRYTVLEAGSISGRFAHVSSNYAFLIPTLAYDPTQVDLTYTRNNIAFASLTQSRNQHAAAQALETLPQVAGGLYSHVVALSGARAPAAFDALSGEAHASMVTALQGVGDTVASLPLSHLRANLDAGQRPGPATAQSGPGDASSLPRSAAQPVWAQVFGNWRTLGGDGNAAEVQANEGGVFVGADQAVGGGWRLGGAFGYTHSDIRVNDLDSSADADSYSATLYGGKAFQAGAGKFKLMAGAAYTWHDISTRRDIGVAGLDQTLKADYTANDTQVFTELGYALPLNQRVTLEPFAGAAWSSLHTGSFDESGGSAALSGESGRNDVTTTTLGLRAQTVFALDTMQGTLRGTVGWRHAMGDVNPEATLAFDGSQPFTVTGAAIARDAAVLELGADMAVARNATLGLNYTGQFGAGNRQNAGSVNVNWRF